MASILTANRENLVLNNMVGKGNTRDEAEAEIGVLLAVLQYLGPVKLKLGRNDGRPRATLEVEVTLPEGAAHAQRKGSPHGSTR